MSQVQEVNPDRRLDFFIVGVQKGGTTALATYLRRHPELQLSRTKEVHHFDDEQTVDWQSPDHARLHDQFDWTTENVLRGEATPIYLYWPQSLERLQRYNPDARLIVMLRHPAFRAFSHWRMEYKRQWDDLPFEEAISTEGRRRVETAPGGVHRVYSYVERGFYAPQVLRLLGLFPRSQILFLRTDEMWKAPAAVLARIEEFLGVRPVLAEAVQPEYIPHVRRRSACRPLRTCHRARGRCWKVCSGTTSKKARN
ncbi:MAG: sulfotransferase [Hyphomonas sp.]|nr:sulfotransferase [Hyphomonas sp.]